MECGRQPSKVPEVTTNKLGDYCDTNHVLLVCYLSKSEKVSPRNLLKVQNIVNLNV